VIQQARLSGFTLDEVRELFFGFREAAPASHRWQKLSQRKIAELEELMGQIKAMRALLRKMMECCHCDTLDQCGKGIWRKRLPKSTVKLPMRRQAAR
jgi:DNA-binding transcriptional MerR regulator